MNNYKQVLFSGKRKWLSIPTITFLGLMVIGVFGEPSTQVNSLYDTNQPNVELNSKGKVSAEKSTVRFTPAPTAVPTPTATPAPTPTFAPKPTIIPTTQPTTVPTINQPQTYYSDGDKDCKDFASHAEAQVFYFAQGGPARDPHRLDADNDGIACDALQ